MRKRAAAGTVRWLPSGRIVPVVGRRIQTIGRRSRPRRDAVVRVRAEFDRASRDRRRIQNSGLDHDGLEPAEPAAVVAVSQVRDWIDSFHGVPEVIDVARRTAGANQVHAENPTFPTRMKHGLVRFARYRAESLLAPEVVNAVHGSASSQVP